MKKKVWKKPDILILGVKETQKNPGCKDPNCNNPGHHKQPNDVWCGLHKMWHGENHSFS